VAEENYLQTSGSLMSKIDFSFNFKSCVFIFGIILTILGFVFWKLLMSDNKQLDYKIISGIFIVCFVLSFLFVRLLKIHK
jgi:hypothetical protein